MNLISFTGLCVQVFCKERFERVRKKKKNGDSLESAVTFFSHVYAMTVA